MVLRLLSFLPPPQETGTILEIGAGEGAVTTVLLEAGYAVTAVEIDPHWASQLAERHPDLTMVNASILDLVPKQLVRTPATLVGCLPYHLSGAILRWLADHAEDVSMAILVLQDEVVSRMAASAGTRERGLLSVVIQSAYAVKPLFKISPNVFWPRPRVWSRAVRLDTRDDARPVKELQAVWRVAGALFQQRRKMIGGRIERLYGPGIRAYLENAELDLTRRPETLTLAELELVTRAILDGGSSKSVV